jgi:hypothetical protein
MPLPPDVLDHAAKRHSVVTRPELLHVLDCRRGQIDGWLRRGLLDTLYPGVHGIPGAQDTPHRQLYAAVLRCGAGAIAGGPSAAFLHGLDGFHNLDEPFVLVPASRRVDSVPFEVRYWQFDKWDRCEVARIPTARVPLTLIDLAALHRAKVVLAARDDAKRKGLIRDDRVLERAQELGRRPGAREYLALHDGFAQESPGERNMAGLFLPGDPQPAWQVWVLPHIRVDAIFLEARLALEYVSRKWHGLDTDRDRDSWRTLELKDAGVEVIDVTSEMLCPERRELTRQRILKVRAERLRLGLPPVVPVR